MSINKFEHLELSTFSLIRKLNHDFQSGAIIIFQPNIHDSTFSQFVITLLHACSMINWVMYQKLFLSFCGNICYVELHKSDFEMVSLHHL